MAGNRDSNSEQAILLGILDAVERGDVTQRSLSRDLGIAVGLVNSYVKRSINKGLIKVQQIPPHRYGYYLTPKGFLEKSQLVASYFYHSFDFFRRARVSCEATLKAAASVGHRRIAFVGASDLTEIAVIVATEVDVEIVAIVDTASRKKKILGIPVVSKLASIKSDVDAVVVTSLSEPQATFDAAVTVLGKKRVYMPSVLVNILTKARRSATAAKRRTKK